VSRLRGTGPVGEDHLRRDDRAGTGDSGYGYGSHIPWRDG